VTMNTHYITRPNVIGPRIAGARIDDRHWSRSHAALEVPAGGGFLLLAPGWIPAVCAAES
jgi:hypothetical protein